jgi:phage terminase large subunit-like protein
MARPLERLVVRRRVSSSCPGDNSCGAGVVGRKAFVTTSCSVWSRMSASLGRRVPSAQRRIPWKAEETIGDVKRVVLYQFAE